MQLGLNLGYMVGRDRPAAQLELTRRAEALGFGSVWAGEAYGSDSPTLLAWLAGQTSAIEIGAAVMQIPGRTPAMTAMTAASLDLLSAGRFRLGLGVSGPQVSEGWHGVRFSAPLARTREYVAIVRSALARELVTGAGPHYPLPLPDGPGKPLKLTIAPVRTPVPVYLAAVGPRNVRLAGEIADGWLGFLVSPDHVVEQVDLLRAGRERAGRTLDGFDVLAAVPLATGADPQACADRVRPFVALYIGGMGSREQNFYNGLAVRMGYSEVAATVQDLYLSGRQREAAAALPFELIDRVALLGDAHRIADRLAALDAAGVTTLAVTPYGGRGVEDKLADLDVVAQALAALRS